MDAAERRCPVLPRVGTAAEPHRLAAAPVLGRSPLAVSIRVPMIISSALAPGGPSGVLADDMQPRNTGITGSAGPFPVAALRLAILSRSATPPAAVPADCFRCTARSGGEAHARPPPGAPVQVQSGQHNRWCLSRALPDREARPHCPRTLRGPPLRCRKPKRAIADTPYPSPGQEGVRPYFPLCHPGMLGT